MLAGGARQPGQMPAAAVSQRCPAGTGRLAHRSCSSITSTNWRTERDLLDLGETELDVEFALDAAHQPDMGQAVPGLEIGWRVSRPITRSSSSSSARKTSWTLARMASDEASFRTRDPSACRSLRRHKKLRFWNWLDIHRNAPATKRDRVLDEGLSIRGNHPQIRDLARRRRYPGRNGGAAGRGGYRRSGCMNSCSPVSPLAPLPAIA